MCFMRKYSCILFHFYIKPQPPAHSILKPFGCILFHFYIKPQHKSTNVIYTFGCILFHFYIKPQPTDYCDSSPYVVSYSISTSNHNGREIATSANALYLIPFLHQTTTWAWILWTTRRLYLIPFLHQTTTCPARFFWNESLYLIPFLHQTTTSAFFKAARCCCILFHFYIKPQLADFMNF